ncbi:MAG: hypothetical protein DBY32_04080 [Phascolarctobacterium sp.]|nr:MAG: hypothetical protein DBY32_04080 [Phascolarctobacterium sp.]
MMFIFNLQLFDGLEIPGIDPDIANEIAAELNNGGEEERGGDNDSQGDDTGNADADSDNKHVDGGTEGATDAATKSAPEGGTDEYDDVPEGNSIPYMRFKQLNERRKAAEAKNKELEEKLKALEGRQQQPPASPAPAASNVPPFAQQPQLPATNVPNQQPPAAQQQSAAGTGEFTAKQIERIAQMAISRAKAKLNLTDDDVENLDYSDKPEIKVAYNNIVAEEMRNIRKEVQQYQADRAAFAKQVSDTTAEFDALGKKLGAYDDVQERWGFIGEKHFETLPQRTQGILKEAFARLQNRRGTYQDMYLINEYFDSANKLYEQQKAAANAAANPTAQRNITKMNSVKNLPKAPELNGGIGNDKVLTVEKLQEILATPGGWDKLTEAEQKAVLQGRLR